MDEVIVKERVRYGETDQMGVAYYGSYAEWFEVGRTEYCKNKGIIYRELEMKGIGLAVVEFFVNYRKPLRYDDEFEIHTSVEEINKKLIKFKYKIIKNNEIFATGYTKHLFISLNNFKSIDAPSYVLEAFLKNKKEVSYGL